MVSGRSPVNILDFGLSKDLLSHSKYHLQNKNKSVDKRLEFGTVDIFTAFICLRILLIFAVNDLFSLSFLSSPRLFIKLTNHPFIQCIYMKTTMTGPVVFLHLPSSKYRSENSEPKIMTGLSPHDHQPIAIFQSAPLPPPPTLPAQCLLFFPCRGGGGRREIRPHIQIQASTLHPQPPVPLPSVHVPLSAKPRQQGPEPPQRSQSITTERETVKRESQARNVGVWVCVLGGGGGWSVRGEEKRKWDAMKLNHRKGRVGQKRGTD